MGPSKAALRKAGIPDEAIATTLALQEALPVRQYITDNFVKGGGAIVLTAIGSGPAASYDIDMLAYVALKEAALLGLSVFSISIHDLANGLDGKPFQEENVEEFFKTKTVYIREFCSPMGSTPVQADLMPYVSNVLLGRLRKGANLILGAPSVYGTDLIWGGTLAGYLAKKALTFVIPEGR